MQKITDYLNKLTKSRFVKNLGITFSENIVTKLFGFFITLILIRNLGPEYYGIYSFIFINIIVLSLLFDFGMENTAIRFSNRYKESQNSIFGLYFCTKIIIILAVVLSVVFCGKHFLINLHKPALIRYIPFFLIGFVGESIFYVNDTYLQCVQKFQTRAIINITRYITVFSFALLMFLLHKVSLAYVTLIFIIPIVFTLFFIPRYYIFLKAFFQEKLSKDILKEIFHYEKWMLVLSSANSISGRIDLYMLSIWVSYASIGVYSAATSLLSIVSFLPNVLGKVMLPKLAETNINKIFDLTLKITIPILGLAGVMLLAIPVFPYIVPVLFGHKYDGAILIVQILTVCTLLAFMVLPIEQSMYPLGKPKQISVFRYIQLAIVIILNIFTIPTWGMTAAATNVVIARILYNIMLTGYFFKLKNYYANSDNSAETFTTEPLPVQKQTKSEIS